jgi:hypothetical protein
MIILMVSFVPQQEKALCVSSTQGPVSNLVFALSSRVIQALTHSIPARGSWVKWKVRML